MSKRSKNLILALSGFAEEFWLPFEDSLGSLKIMLASKQINEGALKAELKEALCMLNFDWRGLAKSSSLLLDPDSYEPFEIANYVKFILYEFLFPECKIKNEEKEILEGALVDVLSVNYDSREWMFSYALYYKLKIKFPGLEYYHLWQVNYEKIKVERKVIVDKEREIGFLRLTQYDVD